ncbi:penicillin-binding transpeptidase domain-containing protein [Bacteroides uniformis]|nr:penicillin-binding transpeptidase domain-containing protein [Bacteroides uniformis]
MKPTPTIDTLLQNKADTLLTTSMVKHKATSGKVIIMETATGYIKAMVGLERKDTLSPFQPTTDFCTPYPTEQRQVATLLAALETGKISLSDTVDVGEGIYISSGDTIKDHNWHRGGYGKITVEWAIAANSRIGEVLIRERAFGDKKSEYEAAIGQIGYGKPDSVKGLDCILNTDVAASKISPIQLITFYNAIANHGRMVQPQLYKDSVAIISPLIASKASIDSIRQTLERTVAEGLGKRANTNKAKVAGKGGTIQIGNPDDLTYIIDFCSYFPTGNPRYTILVVLEKQGLPASGHIHAAELFRQIVEQLIKN